MKYEKYEKALNVIDRIPKVHYIPSVDELKRNHVGENFEKYAEFLLYLSESLTEILQEATEFEVSKNDLKTAKETLKYISNLFKIHLEN